MRYCGVALVFQSLALVFAIVALSLYGYRYHHDRMWYSNVAKERHQVFFPVLQDLYSKSSINWIEVYPGGLWEGHYARELPYSKSVETFLRWPLPQTSIVLVVLVFLVLAELIPLIITGAMKCNYCTPPCHEKGFWHLLVGIVALIAVMIDILTYLQVQALYESFGNSNSGNHSEGYLTLASCVDDSKDMNTDARVARDESNACPLFTFFVCDAIFTILAALCCFVATIALCIAWKRGLNDNDGVTPTESENLNSDGSASDTCTCNNPRFVGNAE